MDAAEALKLVDSMYVRLAYRRPEIDKFEKYYAGQQALTFATDEWLKANGARYSQFSDNWCASVTNAEAERVNVTGIKFRSPDGRPDEAASARASGLWDHWNINEMGAQSSQGFLTSLNAKRSYVMVWGDDAQVTWEHPANVEIEYDWMNPRKRTAALKTWIDETTEYANLYTSSELFKYERPRSAVSLRNQPQSVQMSALPLGVGGGWKPREVRGEQWPVRHSMGVVPIVEIKNRPMLRGEPVSEIEGVIPKQNAINLLWAYLFFAADYASMPARVLLGATPPMQKVPQEDGTFLEVPLTMRQLNETRFAVFSGENAKIDQWDPAKLDVFTNVIDVLVGHISSQTRTPPTYLVSKVGMSNVNGEGLKSSEIGLVKKVEEFQTFATPDIREVFRMIALAKGDNALAEETRLATIVWRDAEIRSEGQLADMLVKKKTVGYPFKWLAEIDGVSPYDLERIMEMKREEEAAMVDFGLQAALVNDANRGMAVEPEDAAA